MRYYRDPRMEEPLTQQIHGRYLKSFQSDQEQVLAHLFATKGNLVAYVKFSQGYDGSNVTDPWVSCLSQEARSLGYDEEHFQIIYLS